MSLVVLLRGVNVGGHRTLRPSVLAEQLSHLDAVSIGAAGTFVIRQRVSRAQVRLEFQRRLPADALIVICEGRELVSLMSADPFSNRRLGPGIVRFVSVLSQAPRLTPPTPMRFPATGQWLVRILGRQNRFVVGLYRRHMRVISYLGMVDRVFGVPATTRNWNTLAAIARVLEHGRPPHR